MITIIKMENCLLGKKSGSGFVTAYSSGDSIACSSLPVYHANIIDSDILTIVQINKVGKFFVFTCRETRFTVSANVITVIGADFASTDTFLVYTNVAQPPTVTSGSSLPPISVVSNADIGVSDGVWINQGSEQELNEPFIIGIWWDLTVNDSLGNELRMLCSHTSSGTLYKMARDADYIIELGDVSDARINLFSIGDLYPYVQFQSRATSLGLTEATISIDITRGWTLEW